MKRFLLAITSLCFSVTLLTSCNKGGEEQKDPNKPVDPNVPASAVIKSIEARDGNMWQTLDFQYDAQNRLSKMTLSGHTIPQKAEVTFTYETNRIKITNNLNPFLSALIF